MPSVSSLLTAILPGGSGADGGGSWLEYADRFDRPSMCPNRLEKAPVSATPGAF